MDNHRSSRRGYRIVIALAVLILHLTLILALRFAPGMRNVAPIPTQSITWILLPQLRPTTPPRMPTAPRTITRPVFRKSPSVPNPRVPEVTPQNQALLALHDYVVCGMRDDKQLPEVRERCAELRRQLPPGPFAPRPPTEEEEEREREFVHELAVQNAPVMLPCVRSEILEISCLLSRALSGSMSWFDSYADVPSTLSTPGYDLAPFNHGRGGKR